jgi:ATP-dependent Clp protease, protease subunit
VKRYIFSDPVTPASVSECIRQLNEWSDDDDSTIELWLSTPGGGVLAGLALYDYLRWLSLDGHHVTTAALGMAASIGAVILQAGDWRVIGRESFVFLHPVEYLEDDEGSEVDGEPEIAEMAGRKIDLIIGERSGISMDKEIWLDSAAALAAGLVDEIR